MLSAVRGGEDAKFGRKCGGEGAEEVAIESHRGGR